MQFTDILIKVLKRINVNLLKVLAYIVALIIAATPNKSNLIAKLQIKKFLGIKYSFLFRFRMFYHFIFTVFENLNLKNNYINNKYEFEIINEHLIEEVKESNESAFIFTSHTGNWELLAKFVTDKYVQITTTARRARKESVQKLLELQRAESGIEVIWRVDNASVSNTRNLIKAVNTKVLFAALIDQDTRVESITTEFFGARAKTPSSLCNFAKKYNRNIYFCFNAKTGPNKYLIKFLKADKSKSTSEILNFYNTELEKFIKKYPDQWVWFHKRWRNSDTEFAMNTEEYIKFLNS